MTNFITCTVMNYFIRSFNARSLGTHDKGLFKMCDTNAQRLLMRRSFSFFFFKKFLDLNLSIILIER